MKQIVLNVLAVLVILLGGNQVYQSNAWRFEEMQELCGGLECPKDQLGASVSKRPTEFKTNIAEQKTEGHTGTTLKVTSIMTKDGNMLDPAVLGSLIVLSLNPNASNSETVVCTSLTTSTKLFTGCTFGYRFDNPTATSSANIKAHSPGEPVIISNTDTYEAQKFVSVDGDMTITANDTVTGQWTFSTLPYGTTSTPTDQRQFVTLYQLQQATSTGGTNGSEAVKGVWEGATQAEGSAGTILGSTGAGLVLQARYATSTCSVVGLNIPITQSDGKLSAVCLDLTENFAWTGTHTFGGRGFSTTSAFSSIPWSTATTNTLHASWFGSATTGAMFYTGLDGFTKATATGTVNQAPTVSSTGLIEFSNFEKLFATTLQPITFTNSNVESTIGSCTVPAGFLQSNRGVKITTLLSDLDDNAGSGNTTFKLIYGGTTIATAAADMGAMQASDYGRIEAYVFASSTASSQRGNIMAMDSVGAGNVPNYVFARGTSAENSASSLTLSITWTGLNTSSDVTAEQTTCELL